MAMYVSLLTRSLADVDTGPPSTAAAVQGVVGAAQRLWARRAAGEAGVAVLASELAYDRALVTACTALGIAVGPEDFSHPTGRARAERSLAERAPFWKAFLGEHGEASLDERKEALAHAPR